MLTSEAIAPEPESRSPVWRSVDELIDRSPNMRALRWHGLHLIAAARRRQRGLPTNDHELDSAGRAAALAVLSAPALLERIRFACPGDLVLIKGFEVALLYEDPALRPFVDVDLLVKDSVGTHRALLAAGFVEVDEPERFIDIHHLRPLWQPGLPLSVEIHHAPKWPDGLTPPPPEELLEAAIPSATGVEGLLTLPPEHHAIVVAAHSWAHLPFRRIQELADVAVLMEHGDRAVADALAERWGVARFWKTTMASIDALFYDQRPPLAGRIWARHLQSARERTVFESHLERWFSPYSTYPPHRAVGRMGREIANEFRAAEGESWRDKSARAWRALLNARRPKSVHEAELGPAAHRRRRRR